MDYNTEYMQRALELAKEAYNLGEVPVGAVVVCKTNGKIVGEGYNLRESAKNALAHAEIIAINNACKTLGGWRLVDCSIYVTLEPCPMCCGAIINARIDDVIFGASDAKSGSVLSVTEMFSLPYNWKPNFISGVLESQASQLLSEFFKELRQRKKIMIIFGIDTSGKTASVAIYDSQTQTFLGQTSIYAKTTHSQLLMPLCSDLLDKVGLSISQIDLFAAANGPGSYTGLRIGVSAIKALSYGLSKPCTGVSTLEAEAYCHKSGGGVICSVITARADLIYTAAYKLLGCKLTEIIPQQLMKISDLKKNLLKFKDNVFFCGDAADEVSFECAKNFENVYKNTVSRACGVCEAAAYKTEEDSYELEVNYLQKVKAEKDLEKIQNK